MNASRAKGTRAETAVVAYLHDAGFIHAERRALRGSKDCGDITGIPDVVIEVKNTVRVELTEWLKEAERERANGDARWGVIWHKRRGHTNPGRWYVTMTGDDFTSLLRVVLELEETP